MVVTCSLGCCLSGLNSRWEGDAWLLSRQFGEDEEKHRPFSFIFLTLLTQHAILSFFKHIQVFLISVLRASAED